MPTDLKTYLTAVLIFAVWLIAGLVLDQLIAWLIRNYSKRHSSRIGYAFAQSFHGLISWIAALIGFWIAFFKTPLPAKINRDLSVWLKVASVFIGAIFIARIAAALVNVWVTRDDPRRPASSIFGNLTKAVVYVVGAGVILSILGVSITPLVTALGVGGLAVGLALQSTLDNLFSGIQIIASHQIEPGDMVRLESGSEGVVEDVEWRNTTIRRPSGELIIVPNSILGKSAVINYSRNNSAYNLFVTTTVNAGSDPVLVHNTALAIAEDIMRTSPNAYKAQEPSVSFSQSDATGLTITTKLPIISYAHSIEIKSAFVEALDKALREQGIVYQNPLASLSMQEKK